uniref:PIH1 domain-containing protein n=1 Tax=Echinostoma caproni TaxID=27848 RepID=A0A183B2U8_9TREM
LKSKTQEKYFVNVCQSEKVPAPREISEEELRSILTDVEGSAPFKIPMSIGEPHAEVDSAGKGCTAYDVIINPTFFDKVRSSELFEAFLMTVIFEGLEHKYGVDLERSLLDHLDLMAASQFFASSLEGEAPVYELVTVPEQGSPEFLIARIQLPKLVSHIRTPLLTVNKYGITSLRSAHQ